MIDRYDNAEQNIDLKERTGWKYIACAKEIYLQLARLHQSKKIKFDTQFQMIVPAIDELFKWWDVEEGLRRKFIVPNVLIDDYEFSKKRLQFMKGNPENFHKEDSSKRAALEKEKAILADKIQNFEIEFLRAEAEKNHQTDTERSRITGELAILNYKRKKYESKTTGDTARCLPICCKRKKLKLSDINEKIAQLETELKGLSAAQFNALEDQRAQQESLHKRRWEVDKALEAYEGNDANRLGRYQNAIDNAEVVKIVRRMDIDDAIDRYYSSVSTRVIHAALTVYALLQKSVAETGVHASMLEDNMQLLSRYADMLYCPEIANRTVTTLYKKNEYSP